MDGPVCPYAIRRPVWDRSQITGESQDGQERSVATGSFQLSCSQNFGARGVGKKTVQIDLVWLLPIFGLLLVGGVLWSNYERPSSTGDHPEHKIADFVWPNGGQDDHQHGGPQA